MIENRHNYLYLIWKDPQSRRNYIVGKLSRNSQFLFEYYGEYKKAQEEAGWKLLDAFPEEKVYESDKLFEAFASRLPDPKRRDIDNILKKYGIESYDGYELLRLSSGRLPIDTYEFINPIFKDDETIERSFYIVGIRHVSGCEGNDCEELPEINQGDELVLKPEPENRHDKFAIQVFTNKGDLLGYVPRYYSESVATRLNKNMTYSLVIEEINREHDCSDCVRVKLRMPRK